MAFDKFILKKNMLISFTTFEIYNFLRLKEAFSKKIAKKFKLIKA